MKNDVFAGQVYQWTRCGTKFTVEDRKCIGTCGEEMWGLVRQIT